MYPHIYRTHFFFFLQLYEGELHMLADANEVRGLTEVPEQVSFQERSTVLCAGARERVEKHSAHPRQYTRG